MQKKTACISWGFLAGTMLSSPALANSFDESSLYPMMGVTGSALALSLYLAVRMYRLTARSAKEKIVQHAQQESAHNEQLSRLQAENEKLKSDLKNYSTILNMSPYPIWQRDSALNVRFYNLAYGEAVEDIVVKDDMEGAPELDKKTRLMAKSAFESSEPTSERRYIVIGGERRLYQISEFPNAQEGTVGFAVDMSEIEALQEDLQRHISAQSDLLESSASAMAIYGSDMRLKSFNYAFVSLWKLDEMWLESQPTYGEILEALREKRKLPEQANFQLFKQQQIKLFTGIIDPHEEFFYLPDGKALRVIAIPHALGGIMFAYEDVTDRLALERSYNTLIAVQRETLDNLHEGVAVFGEDGRLRSAAGSRPPQNRIPRQRVLRVALAAHLHQRLLGNAASGIFWCAERKTKRICGRHSPVVATSDAAGQRHS
ncbi:MAG: hypothetical protein EBR02_06320 [Alphaproteobacteria bacterium]|nr:hypothetical protein [Alphaproteobacteria bacterium]